MAEVNKDAFYATDVDCYILEMVLSFRPVLLCSYRCSRQDMSVSNVDQTLKDVAVICICRSFFFVVFFFFT